MRLHIGLVLGTIAIVAVLCALPASWYSIHVVGPNFMAIDANEPTIDDDIRELEGEWNLRKYVINNQTWQAPPERFEEPMTVMPLFEPVDPDLPPPPNAQAAEVMQTTMVASVVAIAALGLGAFGAWNIARFNKFRLFTAASFILAGILLVGAVYNFGAEMPGAMAADAATEQEGTFSLEFDQYLDPNDGEPAYYSEFSGGYPDNNPRNTEQLSFGPGAGWYMAGMGGVFAILTGLVLVGAPQYAPRPRADPKTVEVVRYVPVPSVTSLRLRRR
jgi:hypothetical protein